MECLSKTEPYEDTDDWKVNGFTIDVEGYFVIVETKNLNGWKFVDTFWNVDVSLVLENNHSKENGNRNQDTKNLSQRFDQSANLQFKVVDLNNTVNIR